MNNEKFPKKNPLMSDDLFRPQNGTVDVFLDDLVDTAPAPLEKKPQPSLMGPEIVSADYLPEALGNWKVVQFKATDGGEYIAHRISDLGYTLASITERDGQSSMISKEDAAKINFVVGTLISVDGKTLQVKEIIHKLH